MVIPPLSRDIGQVERALGALLEPLLDEARLSFAQWTVLVFLDSAGPFTLDELIQRQVSGRVAPEAAARMAVEALMSRGLLTRDDRDEPRLAPTTDGKAVFSSVRRAVDCIADGLYGDLPAGDLDATHRTLVEVARRANARLAASS